MKTITKLYLILMLCLAAIQSSNAQSEQAILDELKEIFEKRGYTMHVFPNQYLILREKADEDFYINYSFPASEATWEGRDNGVYADWTVITQRKKMGEKENLMTVYRLPFALDNEELHTKIAGLLNQLAAYNEKELTTDDEEPMDNKITIPSLKSMFSFDKENITDEDLGRFYFDYTDYQSVVDSHYVKLRERLEGMTTAVDRILQIHKLANTTEGFESLTSQEKVIYKATKDIVDDYNEKVTQGYNDFFGDGTSMLPKNQFEVYFGKINSDPELTKKLESVVNDLGF